MSRRDQTVMLTALALIGVGIIALATGIYPTVALAVVAVAYTVNAILLARNLHR